MNKMWLAVLLVPYMGFAQASQEEDFFDDYQREPSFCAYCGSSLISQSEEADDSSQVVVAEKPKSSSVKRRTSPFVGNKQRACQSKRSEHSDRPRVTQRKKEVTSSQSSSSAGKSNGQQPVLDEDLKEADELSAQIEKKSDSKSSSRPKVLQRKHLSSVDTDEKSGRFSNEKQRPCSQVKRSRSVVKRSSQGSKPYIRESMSTHSSKED